MQGLCGLTNSASKTSNRTYDVSVDKLTWTLDAPTTVASSRVSTLSKQILIRLLMHVVTVDYLTCALSELADARGEHGP